MHHSIKPIDDVMSLVIAVDASTRARPVDSSHGLARALVAAAWCTRVLEATVTIEQRGLALMAEVHRQNREDEPAARLMLEILARTPLDLDGLRRELGKRSVFFDTEQLRLALQWREDVQEFSDGVWAHVPTLADGVVLTHRLTEEELEIGVLDAADGLDLWAQLADESIRLAGGGELRARWSGHPGPLPTGAVTGLVGPEGWLAGYKSQELVGLRLRTGVLHLEPVELADLEMAKQTLHPLFAEAADAAQEAMRRYYEEDDPIPGASLSEIVLGVRRSYPDAFRQPLPPLKEVIEASGLEVWRGFVGLPGAPWYGEPPGLDEVSRAGLRAWTMMLTLHRTSGSLPDSEEVSAVSRFLTRNDDALEAAGSQLAEDPDREPVARAMADSVESASSGVPHYLLSCAAQGRGDAVSAESLLEAAVEADPKLAVALGDLAELRSTRGDAWAARRLYEQAGVEPTYPDYVVLRRFLAAPAGEVGRNRPCPCGSDRKYKMCHGQQLRHPFPLRAEWLWTKAVTFALRARQRDVLLEYADILAGDQGQPLCVALADGLAHDLALFDGELMALFLAERGTLLPDDERALAESWLDSSRRLLEVIEVRPMRGLRCRDLVAGEEIEVLDRTMPAQLERLDLIYGRPLPDGAGGIRVRDAPRLVPRMMRSHLLSLLRADPTGEEVAAFFAPSSGLPQLQTSEGEDVVFCTARYDVGDLDAVWRRLAQELEDTGDDALTELVEVAGRGRVIQGTIRRDISTSRVVVETNSVERLRRLQERVLAADPAARLVDESTVPAEKMLAERAEAHEPDDPGERSRESGLSPEVEQEALAEVARRHGETWPDIELPALSGRTPRQAARDPALRPELEALLDDFDWRQRQLRRQGAGLGMDVDRLRRELGLKESV